MGVYIVLLGIILLIACIPFKIDKIKCVIYFLILWAVSGLRYGIGTDYNNFSEMFYKIQSGAKVKEVEITFVYLNEFLGKYYKSSQVLFIITSLITISLIVKSIYDYSINRNLSIILFITLGYYQGSFNGFRQYIAIAICIYSIRYIFNKNLFKYIIAILIGSLFHSSALVFIPIYFVNKIKISKKVYMIILAIFIGVSNAYNFIIEILLPKISPYYFNKYSDSNFFSLGVNGKAEYIYFLCFLLILIISIFKIDIIRKIDEKSQIYLNLCIISILFIALGFKSQLLFRISLYFSIYFIFLIPTLIISFKVRLRPILYTMLSLFLMFFFFTVLISRDQVIPYKINEIFIEDILS